MELWIVVRGEYYSDRDTVGVFPSKDAAQAAMAEAGLSEDGYDALFGTVEGPFTLGQLTVRSV